MRTIARYIRIYLLLVAQHLKARMSYRADFLVSIILTFFWWVPSLFSVAVIFANVPSLAGWSLEELVFVFGFFMLASTPNGIFFGNAWQLPWQVRSGNFVKYYFRPLNMMFYFMSEDIGLGSLWAVAAGVGLMAWSSIRLAIAWDAVRILGTLVLVLSSSLIVSALMIAAASTAFWLRNSHALLELVSRFRENARYPMTMFNGVFRFIFSAIVPIGFVAFYPAQWILRPGEAGIVPFLTPLVGVACFALAYLVWHRGARRWSGTGT
jgi:ABC-2 type transport system permease protein